MNTFTLTLIIIAVVLLIVLVVLYFVGRNLQKKQDEQNALVSQTAQSMSMLIIDKKRLPVKQSGLPKEIIDQTPFYLRRSKMPIIKAKVGPRMVTLMCDPTIFDSIPVKKEVKAMVSGIYISSVKGLHKKTSAPAEAKGLRARLARFINKNR